MGSNIDQFTREIDASAERAVRAVVEFQKAVSIRGYQLVSADSRTAGMAYGSPVWSGRFRASHTIAIGSPDTRTKAPNPETVGPGATRWPDEVGAPYNANPVSYASQVLNSLQPFDKVIIANALPYARFIEMGGSKFKAPEGVYEVVAQVLRSQFKNITPKQLGI